MPNDVPAMTMVSLPVEDVGQLHAVPAQKEDGKT